MLRSALLVSTLLLLASAKSFAADEGFSPRWKIIPPPSDAVGQEDERREIAIKSARQACTAISRDPEATYETKMVSGRYQVTAKLPDGTIFCRVSWDEKGSMTVSFN